MKHGLSCPSDMAWMQSENAILFVYILHLLFTGYNFI